MTRIVMLSLSAWLSSSALAQPVLVQSTFDAGAEGWAACTLNSGSAPVQWIATGGTPGGFLRTPTKQVADTTYWCAPISFVSELAKAEGGTIHFDLRSNDTSNAFQTYDLSIRGSGIEIRMELSGNPLLTWTHYSAPLRWDAGWRIGNLGGPVPNEATFRDVLLNAQDLWIRAEYRDGPELDDLDNATIYGPASAACYADCDGSGDLSIDDFICFQTLFAIGC